MDLVTLTGTAINPYTLIESPFALSFGLTGGTAQTAGSCDSWLLNAAVTNFTAEVGNAPQALPSAFSANVTTTEHPCPSGDVYGELVAAIGNAPAFLTIETQGALLTDHARVFDGNLGAFYIRTAQLTLVDPAASVPEPGGLGLLVFGVAALIALRGMLQSRFTG
jgi:hypothetical protein